MDSQIQKKNDDKTFSALAQYPFRKSGQISTFSFSFLCKYGQSVFKQIPCKKNLQTGIFERFTLCDKKHGSRKQLPFKKLIKENKK